MHKYLMGLPLHVTLGTKSTDPLHPTTASLPLPMRCGHQVTVTPLQPTSQRCVAPCRHGHCVLSQCGHDRLRDPDAGATSPRRVASSWPPHRPMLDPDAVAQRPPHMTVTQPPAAATYATHIVMARVIVRTMLLWPRHVALPSSCDHGV